MVTHEMSVVQSLCDRVAVMHNGGIAEEGGVSDLFFQNSVTLQNLLGVKSHEIKDGEMLLIFEAPIADEGAFSGTGQNFATPYEICDATAFTLKKQKNSRVTLLLDDSEYAKVKGFMETQHIKYCIREGV